MYLLLQNLDKTLIKTSVFKKPLHWSLAWLPLPWEQPGMLRVGALGQVWVSPGSRGCPLSPGGLGLAQPGLGGTEWGLCCGVGSAGPPGASAALGGGWSRIQGQAQLGKGLSLLPCGVGTCPGGGG